MIILFILVGAVDTYRFPAWAYYVIFIGCIIHYIKIKIIQHGVNLDLFYPKDKPEKFTFICNKGFRHLEDRGGIQYAIRAYLEDKNGNRRNTSKYY